MLENLTDDELVRNGLSQQLSTEFKRHWRTPENARLRESNHLVRIERIRLGFGPTSVYYRPASQDYVIEKNYLDRTGQVKLAIIIPDDGL